MEVINKILESKQLDEIRKKQCSIGLCTGCYDILQSGHAVFFQQCKEVADILVVVVGRASQIRKQKGPDRPINRDNNRLFLLAAMQDVDYVILGEDELRPGKIDCYNICKQLKPDYYILNDDDSGINEKKKMCQELGIGLKLVERTVPDFLTPTSSSEIIKKAQIETDRKII